MHLLDLFVDLLTLTFVATEKSCQIKLDWRSHKESVRVFDLDLDLLTLTLAGHRKERITALMAAAAAGNLEVTRMLIQHGADVNRKSPSISNATGSRTIFPGQNHFRFIKTTLVAKQIPCLARDS